MQKTNNNFAEISAKPTGNLVPADGYLLPEISALDRQCETVSTAVIARLDGSDVTPVSSSTWT